MKKIFPIFTAIQLLAIISFAQEVKYFNYDWVPEPQLHKLSTVEKDFPEIFLKDKQVIEFFYNKEGELQEYKLIHIIIRVNSDDAIQQNNRIYIPSGSDVEFLKNKARVITPAGKIMMLSEKDIKEAEDENTKAKYKFFALEGIEIGSEIEYFYLMKSSPSYSGTRELIQDETPKRNIEFELISPVNLGFVTKSYNGLPELVADTTITEKNVLYLRMDTLEALEKERSSAHTANLQQLVYKLNSNTATYAKDITSYGAISTTLYNRICAPADKAVQKKLKKLIQSINIKYARDEKDKIRIIEQYLKTNFSVLEIYTSNLSDLTYVLDNKVANEVGIVKLFAAIFNQLEIDYQLVLTCSRNKLRFDPDFEAYNFLTDYLLYFPSLNNYLAPSYPISCLGFAPFYLTNNHGLFIKKISLNDFETGIGKIKFIEPETFDKTYDKLDLKVEFGNEILKPKITMDHQMGGYYAQNFQPFYTYYSEEDKKEVTESLVNNFMPNIEIKEITVENEGKDFFGIRPFIVKSVFISSNSVEKAGEKYLFKIGELIGPQMEMYQEEKRKQKVESDYMRTYHRVLNIEIPQGYKITNLDALNMDVFTEENGERTIAFTSTYKLEGNKLEVIVDEYYKQITFPLSEYENYRKVINAAADFNKITVFLEKE